ncbi:MULTISPECIES: PP2C family protein-serine/threonine phosphatase [Streptomyces]|uniref:PP2C family protein-serine/threonine phosphatase n=1 Tax=Streptomyces TaxID=1883 RepID=UPI001409D10A|nr:MULTISPECIES: PP2C family protein-serine/threonine phosphatase [Streptomyces]MDH6226254.1 serine phosphatase RsbU (regulator of sigma subunit) [Streptomyces sp. MJP52]
MLRRGGPVDPAVEDAAGRGRRWLHYARLVLRVLPFLALVFGLIYDRFTPTDVTPVPFFAAAPLIAAPLYTLRATILIGVLSTGCTVLVRLTRDELYAAQMATELFTVFTVAVLAGVVNTVVRRGDVRLATARQMAEAAQQAVMPVPQSRLGALRIASRYEAAQQEANIGGDLYMVQDTPYGVRVILGDVRGKGMSAVTAVAMVVGVFREVAERAPTIEECARRLDQAVVRERDRRAVELEQHEGFVTAVLAEFSRDGRRVQLVNHGHPPPLLLEPGRRPRLLDVGSPGGPLALSDLVAPPRAGPPVELRQGATVLFYTDGLAEARDADGEFYDPVARLYGRDFPEPEALLDFLSEDVVLHAGGDVKDDMALLAVRCR